MITVSELLRKTSRQLIAKRGIDAGLEAVANAADEAEGSAQPASNIAKLVRQRVRALQAACEDLRDVAEKIEYLAEVMPFTEHGWPRLKTELEQQLRTNAHDGLAAWLDNWFTAAGQIRLAALERLVGDVALPPEGALLAERALTATAGLRDRSWNLVQPMLSAGIEGLRMRDLTVPREPVRQVLRLVLIRLAMAVGREHEVEALLAAANAASPSPAVDALRTRWLRQRGDPVGEGLTAAAVDAPTDADVAVELIEEAKQGGRRELGLEAARIAIGAIAVLGDVEAKIERLVYEVPAEIWIAASERALEEAEFEIFDRSAKRAQDLAKDDKFLQAHIAELKAACAAARSAPISEQVDALLTAGSNRVDAGQPALGLPHFERAYSLAPDNADAAMRLADCLFVLNANQPLARVRTRLEQGLDLTIKAQSQGQMPAGISWGYAAESYLRQQLFRAVEPDGAGQGWKGFLAACRYVARLPDQAETWLVLADAATAMDLCVVAAHISRHAIRLSTKEGVRSSTKENAQDTHIITLVNTGRFQAALEGLEQRETAWHRAIRAYIFLRIRNPLEAVRLLRTVDILPEWVWARETLASALLLSGRFEEAEKEAETLRSYLSDREDEASAAMTLAWLALWHGRVDEAERLSRKGKGFSFVPLLVAILKGSRGAALRLFEADLRRARRRHLEEWASIVVPELKVFAAQNNISLPELGEFDSLVNGRLEVLRIASHPVEELIESQVDSAAPARAIHLARLMGKALLALTRDEPDAVIAILDAARDTFGLPELDALRTFAEGPVEREGPVQTRLELNQPDEPPNSEAPEVIPGMAEGPPRPIETLLPPSWFLDHPDPVKTHPIFVRYLPEARSRASGSLPAVHVKTMDRLEPDGYEILVSGQTVEEGRVSPSSGYIPREAVCLFATSATGNWVPFDAVLMRIPRATSTDEPLAKLLTMSAEEVVVRRVEKAARAHLEGSGLIRETLEDAKHSLP